MNYYTSIQPCFSPDDTRNHSVWSLLTITFHWNRSCSTLMMLIIFSGMHCSLKIFYNFSWCTQSKAFSKSTKLRYREDCHCFDCSWCFVIQNFSHRMIYLVWILSVPFSVQHQLGVSLCPKQPLKIFTYCW